MRDCKGGINSWPSPYELTINLENTLYLSEWPRLALNSTTPVPHWHCEQLQETVNTSIWEAKKTLVEIRYVRPLLLRLMVWAEKDQLYYNKIGLRFLKLVCINEVVISFARIASAVKLSTFLHSNIFKGTIKIPDCNRWASCIVLLTTVPCRNYSVV